MSRIRTDKLSSLGDEIDLLREYFEKNHSYRSGKLSLPPRRAFVVGGGVDVLESDWGARPGKLYSDITVMQCERDLAAGLRKMLSSQAGYEWGIINVFSGPRIHHFEVFEGAGFESSWWGSDAGRAMITRWSDEVHGDCDITWADVKSIGPRVLFYHLLTSEVGRHDHLDYLAGTYIFTGSGLVAIAGTQHSGAIGVPALYTNLAAGKTIGEAWKDALTWSIEHSGKKIALHWCEGAETGIEGSDPYKAVLIGDGTLKLPVRP